MLFLRVKKKQKSETFTLTLENCDKKIEKETRDKKKERINNNKGRGKYKVISRIILDMILGILENTFSQHGELKIKVARGIDIPYERILLNVMLTRVCASF